MLHSGRAALSPYLGQSYDETRDMAAMRGADPTWWQRYRRRGCRSVRGSEIRVEHAESVTALLPQVAQELAAGRIVGWLQGPFAWGDRPLGGRSVLADPATSGIEARLREGVTGAPAFRPLPRVRYGDFAPLDPLLGCFQRITGRNELLEVGLAEEGYPLAASPADALLIFMRTEMDILAINRMLVRKVDR